MALPPAKKQKRSLLPAQPTSRQTRIAATALPAPAVTTPTAAARPAAEEPDSDGENYHPAQTLPTSSKKPSCAFTALSLLPSACAVEARSNKTLDLLPPTEKSI